MEKRLFWVVDSLEDNEEIFETLQEADEFLLTLKPEDKPRINICIVKNAYKEDDGSWNYEDQSDTFEIIRKIQ